jgi:hypothetical protein
MKVGQFTDTIMDGIINEIKKTKNQKKIKNDIINPLLCQIINKCYLYITIFYLLLIIIIIIQLLILYSLKK